MRVHVLETGRLVGNETFFRGEGWASLLKRRRDVEFPVYSYLVEHPEGLIAIDTGLSDRIRPPRGPLARVAPRPVPGSHAGLGARMRESGFRPEDVRLAVLTHLDWDHAGNLDVFPNARVLVHRPELAFARTFKGRMRYQTDRWPEAPALEAFDLDREPLGPFPESLALTTDGRVRIVPTPGHSAGHVSVVVHTGGPALFFGGDHFLREDWLLPDLRAERLVQLGVFFKRQAVETSRRIERFLEETPAVLLPAHDTGVAARLAALRAPGSGTATPAA